MDRSLPVGKLPPTLLKKLLGQISTPTPRLVLGPGIGLDCAVVEGSDALLVLKSDPITFAVDAIGWYAVQINANDIATTGASPRWMLATLLLPESKASAELVERIADDLKHACQSVGVALVGGHTEITSGLDRPILVGAMIGEVTRERLVTPRGALPGDRLLLTKGAPIEATAILAREFSERLLASGAVDERELETARRFLYDPGISVLRDAQIAIRAGDVHAMHDPTEGGLLTALWELAQACQHSLWVDLQSVPVPRLSRRICQALGVDPLAAIASGALLLAVASSDAQAISNAMLASGIDCAEIGVVLDKPGEPAVWSGALQKRELVPLPERDAVAALFEA